MCWELLLLLLVLLLLLFIFDDESTAVVVVADDEFNDFAFDVSTVAAAAAAAVVVAGVLVVISFLTVVPVLPSWIGVVTMVVPAAAVAALTTIGVDALLLLDAAFVLAADTTCTLVSPAGTVDKRKD